MIRLHLGDCLPHLREMESDSVDAVVTDPPYGLSAPPDIAAVLSAWMSGETYEHTGAGFMGSAWDSFVPGPRVWREVLRVLKPGGHAVVFAGTRTVDLMGISVRLAGFEVRDTLHWAYWSGFPKSLDISKDIDRLAGAEREVVGTRITGAISPNGKGDSNPIPTYGSGSTQIDITAPATPDAIRWQGFGTGIKPAIEPALLLRKPLRESSIARQVLATGTGALNLDACRFAPGDPMWPGPSDDGDKSRPGNMFRGHIYGDGEETGSTDNEHGRFPANLIHAPKASRAERELGCDGLPTKTGAEATNSEEGQARLNSPRTGAGRSAGVDSSALVLYDLAWVNEVLNPALQAAMAPSAKPVIGASGVHQSGGFAWSTCWCGSLRTDPFHPAIRSIIETMSSSTTGWKTWKRSRQPHTRGCIAAVCGSMMEAGLSRVESAATLSASIAGIGTCPRKAGRSTDDAAHATSVASWLTSASAGTASAADKGGRDGGIRNFHPT